MFLIECHTCKVFYQPCCSTISGTTGYYSWKTGHSYHRWHCFRHTGTDSYKCDSLWIPFSQMIETPIKTTEQYVEAPEYNYRTKYNIWLKDCKHMREDGLHTGYNLYK